jgi:hypothetical protein
MRRLSFGVALAVQIAVALPAWAQVDSGKEHRPGIAVDAGGQPVIDPTKNVLDLVLAAVTRLNDLMAADRLRQDDLRIATKELFEARLKNVNELGELRSAHDREMLVVARDRLDSEAKLRAEFASILQAKETERLNAIRGVDTGAIALANDRANATANALAKTVTDSAATLSALVASTAAETNKNVQQQFTALSTRIAALETGSSGAAGAGAGSAATIAYVLGGLTLLSLMIGVGTAVIVALRRPRPSTTG